MKKLSAIIIAAILCLIPICTLFTAEISGAGQNYTVVFDVSDPQATKIDTVMNLEVCFEDGYASFKASAGDPNCIIGKSGKPGDDMAYMKIEYRLHTGKPGYYGQIYYATSAGETFSEATKDEWKWEDYSGEWATQIIYMKSMDGRSENITNVRFDPLHKLTAAGDVIDVKYIAFFASEADAESFDIEQYRADINPVETTKADGEILPGNWTVPTYSEKPVSADDSYIGTLTYSDAEDGKVTVSYQLNGKTVSYTVENNPIYLFGGYAGTDDLGREIVNQYSVVDPDYVKVKKDNTGIINYDEPERTVGVIGENGRHYVGIFYFLWMGEHGDSGVFDIQKILDKYGDKARYTKTCPEWGGVNQWHFFAEPLYGYYYSNDYWVMYKHMELLANAGVDFVYFDTTNNSAYISNALQLMSICHKLNTQGIDAPQVVFYTNTDAEQRVKQIYSAIYATNKYPDTWFYFDGKPLIIAPNSANIDNFFTIRYNQWPNEANDNKRNAWPWIDWNYPQKIFKNSAGEEEAVNVSVAQHSGNGEFSTSAIYGWVGNRGRSFNGTYDALTDDSYKLGLNIQLEFNYAIAKNVKVVLVTGWNEWVAGRRDPYLSGAQYEIEFCDTCSYEYSRDIEMSRGGYFDNYYMQLVSNIAAIKGAAPTIVQDARNAINVTDDFSQWDNVKVTYQDAEGDTVERDNAGWGGNVYTDTSGRNDIADIKVTADTTNLYFYIECADTIEKYDNNSTWMNVYLNTDGEQTGWYGYDFVLNQNVTGDTVSSISKYSGTDGAYGFTECGKINYRAYGNKMMIEIPLKALGYECYDRVYLQFKVADSDTVITTMEDFYISGDVAPLGRLNYVFQNYVPGITEGEGHKTVDEAQKQVQTEVQTEEQTTEAVTDAETSDAVSTETDANEETTVAPAGEASGCCATAGVFAILAIISASAVSTKKKH